jgi:hypothetical protein
MFVHLLLGSHVRWLIETVSQNAILDSAIGEGNERFDRPEGERSRGRRGDEVIRRYLINRV